MIKIVDNEKRYYLKPGDKCFSTGCHVVYDPDEKAMYNFKYNGSEDDMYYDGKLVNWGEGEEPFITIGSVEGD